MTIEEAFKAYEDKFDEKVPLMMIDNIDSEEEQAAAIEHQIKIGKTFAESLDDDIIV